jgi:hypothetical protein
VERGHPSTVTPAADIGDGALPSAVMHLTERFRGQYSL